jgi:hypothetical protein
LPQKRKGLNRMVLLLKVMGILRNRMVRILTGRATNKIVFYFMSKGGAPSSVLE